MNIPDLTLAFTVFNSLAVPLMLQAYRWTKRVEKRIERIERVLELEPINTY